MPRVIEEPPPPRPAYFWWLLANALALCFAVASWAICLHVFGHPEIPRNFEILRWLKRLPELKRYTVLDVPAGNSLAPAELYRRYYGNDAERLTRINTLLMRNYLTNFDRPLLLAYIEGDYQVEEVKVLSDEDFLSPGFVVRARAMVKPDDFTAPAPYPVIIEYVFPTPDTDAAAKFNVGDLLVVKKSPNCAAVVHVAKTEDEEGDPVLMLTVIPIAYGPYQIGEGESFMIEPPTRLSPGAGFPMFKAGTGG